MINEYVLGFFAHLVRIALPLAIGSALASPVFAQSTLQDFLNVVKAAAKEAKKQDVPAGTTPTVKAEAQVAPPLKGGMQETPYLDASGNEKPIGDYLKRMPDEEKIRLIADIVARPDRLSYEICQVRYGSVLERDRCVFYLTSSDEISWANQKYVRMAKAIYEVGCMPEKALSQEFQVAYEKKAGRPVSELVDRLGTFCADNVEGYGIWKSLAMGSAPSTCNQLALQTASVSGFPEKAWAAVLEPKGKLRQVTGQLVNFDGGRMLLQQGQLEAEAEAVKGMTMDTLLAPKSNAVIRKFAVVDKKPGTQRFGHSEVQMGSLVTVWGRYSKNQSLKLTNGQSIQVPVIEATCLESIK